MKNGDENFHLEQECQNHWLLKAYFTLLLNYGLVISVEIISEVVIR